MATKVKAATKSAATSTMTAPLQPYPLVSVVIIVTKGPMLFISTNLLSKSKSYLFPIISRQLVLRVRTRASKTHPIGLVYTVLPHSLWPEEKLNYKIGPVLSWATMQQQCPEMSAKICLGALGNVFNSTFYDHRPKVFDRVLQESLNMKKKQNYLNTRISH